MDAIVVGQRYTGRWTYSLKSLMFLTFVVAICSAIIGASALLAAVCLPVVLVALIRTVRASAQDTDSEVSLFATFCSSLLIVCGLIGISMAAMTIAGLAVAMIALELAVQLSQPFVRRVLDGFRQLSAWTWERIRRPSNRDQAFEMLVTIRVLTMKTTQNRFAAVRRLAYWYWCPKTG